MAGPEQMNAGMEGPSAQSNYGFLGKTQTLNAVCRVPFPAVTKGKEPAGREKLQCPIRFCGLEGVHELSYQLADPSQLRNYHLVPVTLPTPADVWMVRHEQMTSARSV